MVTPMNSMANDTGSPIIFIFHTPDGATHQIYMDGTHNFPEGTVHVNLLSIRLGLAEALLKKAAKGERITDADISGVFR